MCTGALQSVLSSISGGGGLGKEAQQQKVGKNGSES